MHPTGPSALWLGLFVGCSGDHGQHTVRRTVDGCECLRNWHVDSTECVEYCCNPDSDDEGDWCYTRDGYCDTSWGYCAPVEDCDCSCHGPRFWQFSGIGGGVPVSSCQTYSQHLPASDRFEDEYASCCFNWPAGGDTDELRSEHCCPEVPLGYSERQNNTYITSLDDNDAVARSVSEAQEFCDSLGACSGITCASATNCTARSGQNLGASAVGEFSYLKFQESCTDRFDFVDEAGAACSDWLGDNCFHDVAGLGYSEVGMLALRINCPRACGLCLAHTIDCAVGTSPEAGSIFVPDVVSTECCEVLTAFSYSTLAQTDVLPMPWYGILRLLGITSCVVPEEWGECTDDSDYEHTAGSEAFGNMVRYLCDNPQCNTSNLISSGIVSLYIGQLLMPTFHDMLHNNYLITNCETAPLPSREGTNSATDHRPILPGPPPLPASTVVERTHTRDGSAEVVTREVDIYFRVPTTSTTTVPGDDAARAVRATRAVLGPWAILVLGSWAVGGEER